MLSYIYMAICSFRGVFSYHSPWLVFSMVIPGFPGAAEIVGITSFCRFWVLGESACHTILHFFRSQAWSLAMLICQWSTFVIAQNETVMVLAREHRLSSYDASYLDLAMRKGLPIATLDKNLIAAAKRSKVPIVSGKL